MAEQSARIRIMAVDDHPLLREGIAAIIRSQDDMEFVAEASNGREALDAFRIHRPDVTLMDLQMPEVNGEEAILAIRSEFPAARIVVLSMYGGDVQAVRAIKAGAYGYLLKNKIRKELPDAIRAVHAGRKNIPPEIAAEIAEHFDQEDITHREQEVLQSVAEGNANRAVAARLGISEETVKAHMRNLLAKLGANDRTHAVMIALRRGIITTTPTNQMDPGNPGKPDRT